MEAYTGFARVYDIFMDNIPYEDWAAYLVSLLREYGIEDGLVLELGCGTGNMTRILSKYGYDMIALDNSEEMLMIARDKEVNEPLNILYLLQDMRSFELYGTVRAIVSICDSMNYVTDPEDMLTVFKLVNNYLDPGGIFIFDMNTVHEYADVMGERTIAENREDCSFIWDNYYDEESRMNEYELSIFIRADRGFKQGEKESRHAAKVEDQEVLAASDLDGGELFVRYQEDHFERAYTLEEIKELLDEAGLRFVTAYEAFTRDPLRDDTERMYIIAREHGKG